MVSGVVRSARLRVVETGGVSDMDFGLIVSVMALVLLGAIMVFSAGISGGPALALQGGHIAKHGIHILLGLGLMLMLRQLTMKRLQTLSIWLFLGGLLLLAAVWIPGLGLKMNGSTRWLDLGVQVQPAELMKLFVVIYLADYFARKYQEVGHFRVDIINIALMVILVSGLLLVQPDYGSVVVIAFVIAAMMFLAGVPLKHFLPTAMLAAGALWLIAWLAPYRVERLMTFRNPWEDPFDAGFQLTQALMAIGRGGWWGVGLGNSVQKLDYLPHAENDFLIAIIGEELGAVGILAVMLLFGLLFWRASVIARQAMNRGLVFQGLLVWGIACLFVLNAAIHIGVNLGLLPTKGLTLPLMSTGGSSMLVMMAAVGLLLAVDREMRALPERQIDRRDRGITRRAPTSLLHKFKAREGQEQ